MSDFMHLGHMGMYPHLCGSVLIDLVDEGAFNGSNRQERLLDAWRTFKRWTQHHGIICSFECFTAEQIGLKGNKKSQLSGPC